MATDPASKASGGCHFLIVESLARLVARLNHPKQSVGFVHNPGGEEDFVVDDVQRPELLDLERSLIRFAHSAKKSAACRIEAVDGTVPEVSHEQCAAEISKIHRAPKPTPRANSTDPAKPDD